MKLYSKSVSIFLVTIFFSVNSSQRQNVAPIISTVPEAIITLRKIILNFPATGDNLQYEKNQSSAIVQCAKILYDKAYVQVLDTLQEIDARITYWRYQKNHQWRYFLTKNPTKWVTGASQDIEINNNIEQLQSHQGELYVLLGQLAEYGNLYDHKHKTLFKNDYQQSYVWVDELLDLLVRIKVSVNIDEVEPFIARVTLLKAKLERVRFFKNQILSELQETQMPAHIEQNWLKYGTAAMMLGLGYNRVGQIGDFLAGSFDWTKNFATDTAKNVEEIFFPGKLGRGGLIVQQSNIDETRSSMINFLNIMEINKIISPQEKAVIIQDEARGSSAEFQKFVNERIMSSYWNFAKYGLRAWSLFIQLIALHGGGNVEKEIAGLRNITLLAPAAVAGGVAGGLGYLGYKKMIAKDYSPIRRALLDINSLFVDATKPLDDEQYGKMLYLIYDLKKRATQDVPLTDRVDFVNDLNRIESKEFNVAAKRAIVDDMFRKYSFLRLS